MGRYRRTDSPVLACFQHEHLCKIQWHVIFSGVTRKFAPHATQPPLSLHTTEPLCLSRLVSPSPAESRHILPTVLSGQIYHAKAGSRRLCVKPSASWLPVRCNAGRTHSAGPAAGQTGCIDRRVTHTQTPHPCHHFIIWRPHSRPRIPDSMPSVLLRSHDIHNFPHFGTSATVQKHSLLSLSYMLLQDLEHPVGCSLCLFLCIPMFQLTNSSNFSFFCVWFSWKFQLYEIIYLFIHSSSFCYHFKNFIISLKKVFLISLPIHYVELTTEWQFHTFTSSHFNIFK